MAQTVQNLIDAVSEHLGDRAGGQIGGQPVATAILSSINRVKRSICRKVAPRNLQRNLEIDVVSSSYQYDLPTTSGTDAIRIKEFTARPVIVKDSENEGYPMTRLSTKRRDEIWPRTSTSITSGRPIYYSWFQNTMEIYPFPDGDYTIYIRANIWPVASLAADTDTGMGDEWDDVIEEGATGDCWAKLQQVNESLIWDRKYKQSRREVLEILRNKPDWEPDMDMTNRRSVADPVSDPRVKRWN